jgi:NAD(P)-dependent dehydrogenase (short-subunit alcohol dehydrogenase family)
VAEDTKRLGAWVGTSAHDAVVAEPGGFDMLVVDGDALFAAGGLGACLEGAWEATAAVVNEAFLPAARGGRIVYLAPAPGAGAQADAARAGLENLARTLSVEWARHEITVVTIALGDGTNPGEAAALVAYLASPAGAYFSGCQLDLRGV